MLLATLTADSGIPDWHSGTRLLPDSIARPGDSNARQWLIPLKLPVVPDSRKRHAIRAGLMTLGRILSCPAYEYRFPAPDVTCKSESVCRCRHGRLVRAREPRSASGGAVGVTSGSFLRSPARVRQLRRSVLSESALRNGGSTSWARLGLSEYARARSHLLRGVSRRGTRRPRAAGGG